MTSLGWVVVVPVKPAAHGKSRLAGLLTDDDRADLVRAMALDTIAAARSTVGVRRVVVVTADDPLRRALVAASDEAEAPIDVVDEPDPSPDPLNAALRAGAAAGRRLEPDAAVAALLGDLPRLRADDLAEALHAAAPHLGAFVADAQGTGTTLLAVAPGAELDPRFGAGSARAHAAAGNVELDVPRTSTLRHDVDVPDDLRAAQELATGPRTTAWLARAAAVGPLG
ncbi:2-phospho-L-lactate guanylyltransferase [Cellulomonas alba]|uniref:Phosphoenolpyruvate guanylyltransferase n=1 Tax=Cellulomonas alba TaxID=3053467 RepID=A0ABT7SIM9_9CELL|nr:2-phospho-L-lactate guanylyltransferase [Cellulomonas alba]MDM7856040.1 2-phospho-L-lactate guanylyltransferase [Cellulomonas alba]